MHSKHILKQLGGTNDQPSVPQQPVVNAGQPTKKTIISEELMSILAAIKSPLETLLENNTKIICYKPIAGNSQNFSLDENKFHLFIIWPNNIIQVEKQELINDLNFSIMEQGFDDELEVSSNSLSDLHFDTDENHETHIEITKDLINEFSTQIGMDHA